LSTVPAGDKYPPCRMSASGTRQYVKSDRGFPVHDSARCVTPITASTSADPDSVDCVFLTCFDFEFGLLSTMLRYSGLQLHLAGTLEQADFLLTVTGATVLLCDAVFLDGAWTDCAKMLADVHPQVSLLVVADRADGRFVSDAPARGACAVCWKPLGCSAAGGLIRAARETSLKRIGRLQQP
jgi:hypothetical protein